MPEPQYGRDAGGDRLSDRMKGWELGLLALVALVMRLAYLNHAPQFDELYHVLAARSWAENGTLALADGVYERTRFFTQLIGVLFRFLPDTLAVARIPAVLAGTAWVVLVAYWTGGRAGRMAGWIAGLLLCADPEAIVLSQYARFYTLHGLLFFAGAALCFTLIDRGSAQSLGGKLRLATVAALALLAALYLQVTTLIGVMGIALWAATPLIRWWLVAGAKRPLVRWVPVAVVAIGLVLVVFALRSGVAAGLWQLYRQAPFWGIEDATRVRFYERWLARSYPMLLALLPVAFLVAASRFRRVTIYAAVVFGFAVVLHSFAGSKTERYIYYVMPFFFIIWGVALAVVLPAFRAMLERMFGEFLPRGAPSRVRSAAAWGAMALLALFAAYYSRSLQTTRLLLRPGDEERPFSESEWAQAAPRLRQLADSADVLVSTALPKSLYFLGGGDVTLSVTELRELEWRDGKPVEFSIDGRTGRPTIGTPESLERVMACYSTGLVLVERNHWRVFHVVTDSTADYLERHAEEVALPPEWKLKAFRWNRGTVTRSVGCPPTHRPFTAVSAK